MTLTKCSMPVLPAGKSFEQAYSLICFSRANRIRHNDVLASFKCMAKHYPDVWTHVEKVVASNVTGGAPYASLLMDAAACALFMAWRRDDFSHLGCYAADGPMSVQSGEARAIRFVGLLGEQFNAWIQVEEGPNDAQA